MANAQVARAAFYSIVTFGLAWVLLARQGCRAIVLHGRLAFTNRTPYSSGPSIGYLYSARKENHRNLNMSTKRTMACLTLVAALGSGAWAQSKAGEEAAAAYNKGFYFNAIDLYKKAFTMERSAAAKAELIYMVGECYRSLGDPAQAEVWYEKANKAQYDDPLTYLWIGESLKEQGKYPEAIQAYMRYKEKKPSDVRADAGIAACEMAQQWIQANGAYQVSPEVLLNSPQYDFAPTWADQKNEDIVFSSSREASTGVETDQIVGESFSDLYLSTRDQLGKWSEPLKLPATVNTAGNEGAAILNSTRDMMYFTRCTMEAKKSHGCDIYMAKKLGNEYTEAVLLELVPEDAKSENDTLPTTVGHPALSPDNTTLVFSSNMEFNGSRGGKDLWMVKLGADGMPTGVPSNLGPEINTDKQEMFPFIRPDGSLYFTSDGWSGMGGTDIFRAEKTGENAWGHAENLKAPVNSSMDDFAMVFDGTNDRGFFTSNRPGGKGQDDIWQFYKPDRTFVMQGTTFDKDSGDPIPGVTIEVVGTDGSSFSMISDDAGAFVFDANGTERFIKENVTYSVRASKQDYLVVKDQVTTVGAEESTTFVKEYFLQFAGDSKRGIAMPEVQYELGSYALTQPGKDSLEFLHATLIDNPTIVIELNAHTDTRGSDKANMTLSQNRAQSCVNFLVTKGIDPARMVAKGFGETMVRVQDAEIAAMKTKEEQEAAHQKNRRTEFRVLSWDHVPKEQ
jgi:peptidoglycan-associated lipoprotein